MADKVLAQTRIKLTSDLSETDIKLLVDDLQHERVIHPQEVESILHQNKERADRARQLIDSVTKKGKEASRIMLTSLKNNDNPLYKKLGIDSLLEAMSSSEGVSDGQLVPDYPKPTAVEQNETNEYKMNSIPRGLCVIINNENFRNPDNTRVGSRIDANSLQDVFKVLGFKVELHQDLKADEIRNLMISYSKDSRHGDCFVCCVLSHGEKTGILGQDEKICPQNDITSPFDGVNCPILAGKPKVFFIQACRGHEIQSKVTLRTDDFGGGSYQKAVSYTIAKDSDFLIAMSTVQGYYSIRNPISGSWFIQTLCKHLKDGSIQGHDILKILTDVNNDVSKKEGTIEKDDEEIDAKMTPAPYFTLRKTLIFRVPEIRSYFKN